jgi:EAL domain-containing protein (putative c-di-GMP-specific phosphodiesterase class I)
MAVTGKKAGVMSPLDIAVQDRDRHVLAMVEEALQRKRAFLAFQPIMQARRPDAPAFWEGLIRIQDATGRVIPAHEFIGAVEAYDLGRRIDCMALEIGLATLAEVPSLRLSVNMSARSIGCDMWLQVLNRGLAIEPTVGERLILEITESSAMLMPEVVTGFMADLQRRGLSFALDDFGAGYTSFRYLRDFDFDILKIDGDLIRGVSGSPDHQVLARALIDIGRHFEMFTVAEAVETLADANWLIDNGIDCLQGYYFSAPTTRPWWQAAQHERRA